MIIRKQPIISWLLDRNNTIDGQKLGIPKTGNDAYHAYLCKWMNSLAYIREKAPNWGLPELLMPSFEEMMEKCAKSFYSIDQQLFQECYEDNVCGILLSRDCGTIVYGFGENKLYVWLFIQNEEYSDLYLAFYAEPAEGNNRRIFIPSASTEGDLWFTEEGKEIYNILTAKIIAYLGVKRYVEVETVVIPPQTIIKLDDTILSYKTKEKIRNDSGQEVIVMDSRWFRKIINDNDIFVRGHFKLQNKKNEEGEWYKQLIFVNSYSRHGYHRNAKIETEDFP